MWNEFPDIKDRPKGNSSRKKLASTIAILSSMIIVLGSIGTVIAAVWTDQDDYTPGSVVTISGDNSDGIGYSPGETVIVRVDGPYNYDSSCSAIVDESGTWSCQITLSSDETAIGNYAYTATGQTSGVTQSGTFTDAPPHNVNFATSGLPNGVYITVSWSKTNPAGNPASGTTTFSSPGSSASEGTTPGTQFTYSFPSTVTHSGQTYTLSSSSPPSGFTAGTAGSSTTVTATYTLASACTAPSITDHPSNANKVVGQSVTFSVTASGTTPLTYQWRKDSTNIDSATSSSYEISSLVVSDSGDYDVMVNNSCGSIISNVAILAVDKATPTITWDNPADIIYGTPLSEVQLNAEAPVAGDFIYDPEADTILNAGLDQILHVDFIPTDTTNYNTASKDVTINVSKRPITVTADNKTKVYGAADPTLTYQITSGSLVGTDSFSGALSRVAGEDVGTYAIQQGDLALSSNYDLTYVGDNLVINRADTTTTVVSSAYPSILGQSVTFTATVGIVPPGAGSPSGNVEFFNGTASLGTGSLSGGTATLSTSSLSIGSHTINAKYLGDGNFKDSTSSGISQWVIYNWNGFFRPVDNLPTVNTVKAGSAIPVKFSLNGNQGLSVFATGFPKSVVAMCNASAPIDTISDNETVTAGQSSLQYDVTTDQYTYVWKTEKTWSNCRQLQVKLIDGQTYIASFKFTK